MRFNVIHMFLYNVCAYAFLAEVWKCAESGQCFGFADRVTDSRVSVCVSMYRHNLTVCQVCQGGLCLFTFVCVSADKLASGWNEWAPVGHCWLLEIPHNAVLSSSREPFASANRELSYRVLELEYSIYLAMNKAVRTVPMILVNNFGFPLKLVTNSLLSLSLSLLLTHIRTHTHIFNYSQIQIVTSTFIYHSPPLSCLHVPLKP